MFKIHSQELTWEGQTLVLETGRMARQADGAVLVTYGGTTVLCTAVCARKVKAGQDFFPLTIHYLEKSFAVGKIPGGFFKREGRPSEFETLTSRLIDRPLRPLFHPKYLHETQVICTTLEHDLVNSSDIPALIGASAALALSGAPLIDPVAAARVGLIDDKLVINPSIEQMKSSKLDLVVAGTREGVLMVESECQELSEEQMLDAVMKGYDSFQPVIEAIDKLVAKAGRPAIEFNKEFPGEENIKKLIAKCAKKDLPKIYSQVDKQKRSSALDAFRSDVLESVQKEFPQENGQEADLIVLSKSLIKKEEANLVRQAILDKKDRIDGRKPTDIRPIDVQTGVLARTHGSALFTRGETQALAVATLGTGQDEQIIDALAGEYRDKFLLHYNFPPYSVNEASPLRPPGRREIGHGKLAWRSIKPLMPSEKDFSYTVRLVSEILESNGSSSMATVCASSLALMDAGVPIKSSCAGIAMGLIKSDDSYAILSDILGDEDSLGDMDFKVAGTKEGITALQMDIKITSITKEIMADALKDAKAGRIHILTIMDKVIDTPREELSAHAPRITVIQIPKDKIRDIIGTGGKVIREICEATTTKIDIEDDGRIQVSSSDAEAIKKAVKWIKSIIAEPEIGKIYQGKVVKITQFGAFINFLGARDGMVHISELASHHVDTVEDILSDNQEIYVECLDVDPKGKIRLSMRTVDQETGKANGEKASPRNHGGSRNKSDRPSRGRFSSEGGSRFSRNEGRSEGRPYRSRDGSSRRGGGDNVHDVGFLQHKDGGRQGYRSKDDGGYSPRGGDDGNRSRGRGGNKFGGGGGGRSSRGEGPSRRPRNDY